MIIAIRIYYFKSRAAIFNNAAAGRTADDCLFLERLKRGLKEA